MVISQNVHKLGTLYFILNIELATTFCCLKQPLQYEYLINIVQNYIGGVEQILKNYIVIDEFYNIFKKNRTPLEIYYATHNIIVRLDIMLCKNRQYLVIASSIYLIKIADN